MNSDHHIEHPEAYARARENKIKSNAFKGRRKRWLEGDASRQALLDAINALEAGPQRPKWLQDAIYADEYEFLPEEDYTPEMKAGEKAFRAELKQHRLNPFVAKMAHQLREWGDLTPGQEAAVRRVIEQSAVKKAEFQAQRAAEHAASKHVGLVGERSKFEGVIMFKAHIENAFGNCEIVGIKQGDDVLIYKGNSFSGFGKGDKVRFQAKVKNHGVREEVAQTEVNRPTKIERVAA